MATDSATTDNILSEFPAPVQDSLTEIWKAVPADRRRELEPIVGRPLVQPGQLLNSIIYEIRDFIDRGRG